MIKNKKKMSKILKLKKIKSKKTKKKSPDYYFIYYDTKGKQIKNPNIIDRLNKLRIPPAYQNVIISPNPKNKIQCIGVDEKGRKQYIYHPEFVKKQSTKKFSDVKYLGQHISNIQSDYQKIIKQMSYQPPSKWEQPKLNLSIILYLLDKCNFRVGNKCYADKYGSYGATTLKKKHIFFHKLPNKPEHLEIKFIGKKGVLNQVKIINHNIIKIIKELIKNKKEKDYIFESDRLVSSEDVSSYLKKYDPNITPKMFRTWYGNYYFIEKLLNDIKKDDQTLQTCHHNETRKKKYMKSCCHYIADRLHNTPAISKKAYLDSLIQEKFIKNPQRFINYIKNNQHLSNNKLLLNLLTNYI